MCGEQLTDIGSSPRVRGTEFRGWIRSSRAVHPRVCGEQAKLTDAIVARFIPACAGNSDPLALSRQLASGSSPRVRGTATANPEGRGPPVHPRVCGEQGSGSSSPGRTSSVHPRVCGEQNHPRRHPICPPPRVRGTAYRPGSPTYPPVHPRVCGEQESREAACHLPCRFIPACAGNSYGSSPRVAAPDSSLRIAVHPRVCGEQGRMTNHGVRRFIPACAGNSHWTSVHPRVCGEQGISADPRSPDAAVHPRVCGEQRVGRPKASSRPVHPRVCGEQRPQGRARILIRVLGSSPRVRGTDRPPTDTAPKSRFIPACAGNSAANCVAGFAQHNPRRFIPACAGNSLDSM